MAGRPLVFMKRVMKLQ